MKRKRGDLTNKEIMVTLDTLYTAASSVKGRNATKLLLKNLLTFSEMLMIGRRLIIGRMILRGDSQREICASLRVGKATVYRVQKWLDDELSGLKQAVEKTEKEFDKRTRRKLKIDSTIVRLKRKYPAYFLFFPTPGK